MIKKQGISGPIFIGPFRVKVKKGKDPVDVIKAIRQAA